MNDHTPNYWTYRIFRQGFDGQPEFVASYLAETDREALDADLAAERSHLKHYLGYFFGVDAAEYVREDQLRAQALLGGLVANAHCALHSGLWIDVAPPAAQATKRPDKLDEPSHVEGRVRIWLQERGKAKGV
jgi:hypothetical protein